MKKLLIGLTSLLLLCACAHKANIETSHSLLPIPQDMQTTKGYFTVSEGTKLYIGAPADDKIAIANTFAAWSGLLEATEEKATANCIAMEICDNVANVTSPEGYTINVTKERIDVKATTAAGLFYAAQTLQQLADSSNTIPACTITDEPEFAYRGLMLDVSRHFFGKEFIKKQIDAMAHFKMNRLHLHLTDAAGWRIEIKKYPRLTEFAAWRSPAIWKDWWFGDRKYVEEGSEGAYGGYYTQEDIKELVAYAEERYITIIPEIEMPAHSEEVLTAYPELSCTHEPYKQADFCVGNEKTYEFLENV
ncbi:MAG: beta-N-acetylhexosaminidase, partial [Bacteroidaceae bacterium]|nr:beta-N-acetylhexosaminidase [Bacteroidaceae bacterium]